ncbi:MAG: NAD(P)/FAD-dependent oxidoreductase [Cyanothece sp. SIO1E1]|nr:NAD(P)/FAD-dependent oxidoreductase [Cyanothece sp. SIO1E1]
MRKHLRVVIVGSGFGGMQAAQSLASAEVEVLLIDRNNYHTFVPLLYQVAVAELDPGQIAYPVRTLMRRSPNLNFLVAEVKRIDFSARRVETDAISINYDFLILATGSQTRFFGVPGASEYALSMRSVREAIALRNQILHRFEQAAQALDMDKRQQLLTFAIVGGGPTGVELAGALVELVRGPLRQDFPSLDPQQIKIVLIQSEARLLADLPPKLGNYTCRKLRQLGVQVYLQSRVSRVLPTMVQLQDGETISAATIIWTAGMTAAMPDASTDLSITHRRQLVVRPTLQLLDHPEAYAIGDLAYIENHGKTLTGVAPEALQQGVAVAQNIKRQLKGQRPTSFSYFNKGRLAIIGCYTGVGKIGPFAFTGFLAWFMWLAVHCVYLPGFRNRLLVLISWFHAYLLGERPIRLILPLIREPQKAQELCYAKEKL